MSSSVTRYFLSFAGRTESSATKVQDLTSLPIRGGESATQSRPSGNFLQDTENISTPSLSDEDLMSLICAGNKEALASLFRRYARVVRGVAYRVLSRRRYLTSRHFYTHLDLDQAENQLSDLLTTSGRRENSMEGALDRKEALQSWCNQLSESQQQTLYLFFFEGYTFDEIAAKLGQTVGNARNHYYRGLDKLRKQISAGKLPGKEAIW